MFKLPKPSTIGPLWIGNLNNNNMQNSELPWTSGFSLLSLGWKCKLTSEIIPGLHTLCVCVCVCVCVCDQNSIQFIIFWVIRSRASCHLDCPKRQHHKWGKAVPSKIASLWFPSSPCWQQTTWDLAPSPPLLQFLELCSHSPHYSMTPNCHHSLIFH
jgi:hypothetical protein